MSELALRTSELESQLLLADRAVLESSFFLVQGVGGVVRLTNSITTQAQIWDFDLAHPNINPIDELLKLVKWLALWITGFCLCLQ